MSISSFRGTYFFLSNFFEYPVEFEGITYPTNEHAFAAAKWPADYAIKDEKDPSKFIFIRDIIATCKDPKQAKYWGRSARLPQDWDNERSLSVMYTLIEAKFSSSSPLSARLVAQTGSHDLIEGNYWHDNKWGACTCYNCRERIKLNLLGRLLVNKRNSLQPGKECRYSRAQDFIQHANELRSLSTS